MIALLQEPNLGKKGSSFLMLKNSLFAHFQSSQNPMHGTELASNKLKWNSSSKNVSLCKLLRVYVAFSGFLSQGNKQFSSKKTGTTALFACRDLSLTYKSAAVVLSFVFVNSWRGERDSRVPTVLMAVLMPLMCDLGQWRRDLPKQSVLNYYQSCTAHC